MRSFILNFKFISVLFLAICLSWIVYRIVIVQHGYSVQEIKTEPWLGNVARMRELLYKNKSQSSDRPVIYIVSGSNALFSTASDVIENETGYEVNNYSLHAGMHIDLLFSQIKGKVKKGDIVVAPLEWSVLSRTKFNQFDYENYLFHFNQQVNLSPSSTYKLYTSVPLKRWWSGLNSYVLNEHKQLPYTQRASEAGLQEAWIARPDGVVYGHQGLSAFGDININKPITASTWRDKSTFQVIESDDPAWVVQIERWANYFRRNDVNFILTFPILLEGNSDEIKDINTWRKISRISNILSKSSAPLHCNPIDAVFSSIYRYDTSYHANAEGARLRSKSLANCLVDYISLKNTLTSEVNPELSSKLVAERLSQQKINFGVGNMPFQLRLRALNEINDAIKKFKFANGNYPLGDNVSILKLPSELKRVISSDYKFSYWSNGAAYKLIVDAPSDECAVVYANWPNLIYQKSNSNPDPYLCNGFGYWSSRAAIR